MVKRRSTRVAYRCRQCKLKRAGSAGMVACPECGGVLVRLYAGTRKATPKPKPVTGA